MRLLSRLEAKQKSGAIRYLLFRQSPETWPGSLTDAR